MMTLENYKRIDYVILRDISNIPATSILWCSLCTTNTKLKEYHETSRRD